ncbi:hypothetical protein BDU57DRAFT_561348 [Ampelomyces quisqualis]|uniref:BTB domain-containing protein n=1 Tax=Ampelomyces quisqualis TaxID=50730 RepID=A0A6A5QX13_AMPQU|nr:hypothetical protein BDU57DRAFT_561348 [Ampelomyces quisqualis]
MAEPKKPLHMCISKRSRFTAPSIVKIRVGTAPNCVEFAAHESFLVTRSEFFRRALNGNWEEAESRIVKLPDDVPEVFGLYLNLVYTGHLPTERKSQDAIVALDWAGFWQRANDEYTDLINVYVLAEKLQDTVSKNATVVAIVDVAQLVWHDGRPALPSFRLASKGFDETPEGSQLRRLLIELSGNVRLNHIILRVHNYDFNSYFVKDLADRLDRNFQLRSGQRDLVAIKAAIQEYME